MDSWARVWRGDQPRQHVTLDEDVLRSASRVLPFRRSRPIFVVQIGEEKEADVDVCANDRDSLNALWRTSYERSRLGEGAPSSIFGALSR